jgi:hypothetical protein
MAPINTVTATTMNQHVRNQMSVMAGVAAILCAWVLFLAASYTKHLRSENRGAYPISVSAPMTSNQ